jgi:salicylate hydroxylase
MDRYWRIHRADYQRILYDAAIEAGVEVRLGCPISSVGTHVPFIVLRYSWQLKAGLVVGPDGVRSKTRRSILGDRNVEALDSPNCAYRATVLAEVMNSDPAVSHLMMDVSGNLWIGHERHIMAYSIRNGSLHNIVLSHPGTASVGKWNESGDL